MNSSPTSSILFRDPASGDLLDQPREWQPAQIELAVDIDDWESLRLWRNGAPMRLYRTRTGGHDRILADWPRSGAGHYRLQLVLGRDTEEETVRLPPQKIGVEAFVHLLTDLESRLPFSISLGLQQMGGLGQVELTVPVEDTIAHEWDRLKRAINGVTGKHVGLAAVMDLLAEERHAVLAASYVWTRVDRARRPHPVALLRAYARPMNFVDGSLLHVEDTRYELDVDVYENRVVRSFYDQVSRRLRRLITIAEANANASAVWSGMLSDLGALHVKVKRARARAAFLNEVSPLVRPPDRVTMVLLKRAPYRFALQGLLEFRRSSRIRFEEPGLDAPLENLPSLYEAWGTLLIVDQLIKTAGELGYRVVQNELTRRGAGTFLELRRDGRPALVLTHPERGAVVRAVPQRSYGNSGTLRSLTYRQVPDLAIEIEEGTGIDVLVFDPKYKLDSEESGLSIDSDALVPVGPVVGSPKKVDIDKMHAYRDAIRGVDSKAVVRYAAILYPGPNWHGAQAEDQSMLSALSALPGSDTPLRASLDSILNRFLSR
jgi:hypothetical protein